MWVYRQGLDSALGEAYMNGDGSVHRDDQNEADPNYANEVLFEHEGIVKLEFAKESNDYLTVTNFDDYAEARVVKVRIPRAHWVWISCAHREDYYSVYVRDYRGRVLHSASKRVAHSQTPNHRTSR